MAHHFQAKHHKETYQDRGIDTYLEGISDVQQIKNLANDGLARDTFEGVRDRLMVLVSHFGLLCGESARGLEFADLHSIELPESKHSRCVALIAAMRHGKTNQGGRVELAGMLCNKHVEICPLGGLAMHLFCRFQLGSTPPIDKSKKADEQYPNFSSNES